MKGGCWVYINRAKALLLVGTISAGCASTNDDEGPDNAGAGGNAGAGAGGTAGAPGQGGGGNGGSPSAGAAGQGGAGSGGGPSGQGGGGNGGTLSTGGSDSGRPDAGPDAGDAGAGEADAGRDDVPDAGGDGGSLTCDDSVGSVVSCAELGQTECPGLEGVLSSDCEMIGFILKPVPANAARNCMIALEPPDLCDVTNTYACISDALESSCPDPEADDECTAIAAACDDSPDFGACSATLSGMTQSGRDQMVTCATEACDLDVCIEGLTF